MSVNYYGFVGCFGGAELVGRRWGPTRRRGKAGSGGVVGLVVELVDDCCPLCCVGLWLVGLCPPTFPSLVHGNRGRAEEKSFMAN